MTGLKLNKDISLVVFIFLCCGALYLKIRMMKILNLTLKRKWFDMIASGEKKYEYRELKHYWKVRLEETYYEIDYDCPVDGFKQFDIVRFRNGYGKNALTIDVEFKGTSIGEGRSKWGAEIGHKYYCIKLGKIL